MMKTKSNTVVRAIAAVATSILTGVGAGAALAHKPLVVRSDHRPR